ncbi:hypothetical protein C8R43DRAFT_1004647 [Mycena crocata]|nr:hypothetical protein C8R43DRAFT_1004647 [Mycena crocata]
MPHIISYALSLPALLANVVIFGTMGYIASSAIQDSKCTSFQSVVPLRRFEEIYTDGIGAIGPMIAIIIAAIESGHFVIVIILKLANKPIASLAVILLDSLLLIPCYAVALGILPSLNGSWGVDDGSCSYSGRVSRGDCRSAWRQYRTMYIVAMALQGFGLLLVLIDLARVIRIHRAEKLNKNVY